MAITEAFTNSATIGTTEYSLPNASTTLTARTDNSVYQIFIDTSNVTISDLFECVVKEKATSGGSQRTIFEAYFPITPNWVFPALMLGTGWDVTIKKISGTDRSFSWSIRSLGSWTEAYTNSASISTTEYSLPNNSTTLATLTTAGVYQVILDVSSLTVTEQYEFKIYDKVTSGGTKNVIYTATITGAMAASYVSEALVLMNGFDFTLKKLSGTDRTIGWSIRQIA